MPVQPTYPGVYIEERPSGAHAIVGVSTSVTAFVGGAAKGPVDTPVRVFSVADYERTFGPALDASQPMGLTVRHYFANGGAEAVIVRAVGSGAATAAATLKAGATDVLTLTAKGKGVWATSAGGVGVTIAIDHVTSNPDDLFDLVVRYSTLDPASNLPVLSAVETFANLSMSPAHPRYAPTAISASQLVVATVAPGLTTSVKGSSVGSGDVTGYATKAGVTTLRVSVDFGPAVDLVLFATDPAGTAKTPAQIVTAIQAALDAAALPATAKASGGTLTIESKTAALNSAVTIAPAPAGDISQDLKLGLAWGGKEVSGSAGLRPADGTTGLSGGADGAPVQASDIVPSSTTGVYALDALLFPRFNLLCLPGVTASDQGQIGDAMAYCALQRAFLIVDSPPGGFASIPPNLGSLPALGEHGAIYYPRLQAVQQLPGGASTTLDLPACGAVAGVMARTDTSRGVWKAPAGRDAGLVGIADLTAPTDDNLSGQLNPKGVNVLRAFPGAGIVVWGARTLKGDDTASSEFKYIPVRRLTDYIASSLYLGTQFAVFEPNDPDLWGQLRFAVGNFMRGLFRQGAFQQSSKRSESDSFFVVCDDTVNPQPEIDLGRVHVLVGFAPLKPAEFVIVTITQISQLEG